MLRAEIDLPEHNSQRVGPNPFVPAYDTTLDPISPDFDPHSWGEQNGRVLGALLVPDAPAKTVRPAVPHSEHAEPSPYDKFGGVHTPRVRLNVPMMPPEKGDACQWACLPDSIERDCRLHSGYQIA